MNASCISMPTRPTDGRPSLYRQGGPDRYLESALTVIAGRWTETDGKAALWERTGADPGCGNGHCEGCGHLRSLDAAHRLRRSQGGLWTPINLLGLCRPCHDSAHDRPKWAQGLGWEVEPGGDPGQEAAWISHAQLGWGWYLLAVVHDAERIRRHVVIQVEPRWDR